MRKLLFLSLALAAITASAFIIRDDLAGKSIDHTDAATPDMIFVSYLEANGWQYFDTGIVGDDTISAEGDIYYDLSNNSCALGSVEANNANRCWPFYSFGQRYYLGFGRYGAQSSYSIPFREWIHQAVWTENKKVFLSSNGVVVQSHEYSPFLSSKTLYMFAMNANGAPNYFFYGRIGRVQIYSSGVLVRDYTPIRFVNESGCWEGAMYDSVSDTKFRNQGTVPFIIGPDL